MVYAFTLSGLLALVAGLVAFHGVLHLGRQIVIALFALFLLAWFASGGVMLLPILRRVRGRPKRVA